MGVSTDTEETGAVTIVWDDGFNVLNGYLIVTPPPQAFIAPAGWASMAVLRFPTAPLTLSGWNWFQYFSEV